MHRTTSPRSGARGSRSLSFIVLLAVLAAWASNDPSVGERLALEPLDGEVVALCIDNAGAERFLYAAARGSAASVVKISLLTHERVESFVFQPEDRQIHNLVVLQRERALVATFLSGAVSRIAIEPSLRRTVTTQLSLGRWESNGIDHTVLAAAHPAGKHVYVSTSALADGVGLRVTRLDSFTLDIMSEVELSTADRVAVCVAFAPQQLEPSPVDGSVSPAGVLYFSIAGVGMQRVVEVRVNATGHLQPAYRRIVLGKDDGMVMSLVLDGSGALLAALRQYPARIIRIRTSDFTRQDAVDLGSGTDRPGFPFAAVLDPTSRRVFFACLSSPLRLVSAAADDLTLLDVFKVEGYTPGAERAVALALDAAAGRVYVGTGSVPGAILVFDVGSRPVSTAMRVLRQVPPAAGKTPRVLLVDETSDAAAPVLYAGRDRTDVWALRIPDLSVKADLNVPSRWFTQDFYSTAPAFAFTAAALHAEEGRLFLASSSDPVNLMRVKLPSMLHEGTTLMTGLAGSVSALLVASSQRCVLLATATAPPQLTSLPLDALAAGASVATAFPLAGMLGGISSSAVVAAALVLDGGRPGDNATVFVLIGGAAPFGVLQMEVYASGAGVAVRSAPSILARKFLSLSPPGGAVPLTLHASAPGAAVASFGSENGAVTAIATVRLAPVLASVGLFSTMPSGFGRIRGSGFMSAAGLHLLVNDSAVAVFAVSASIGGGIGAIATGPLPRQTRSTAVAAPESLVATWADRDNALYVAFDAGAGTVLRIPAAALLDSAAFSQQAVVRSLGPAASSVPPTASFVYGGDYWVVGGFFQPVLARIRGDDFTAAQRLAIPMPGSVGAVLLHPGRGVAVMAGYSDGHIAEVQLDAVTVSAPRSGALPRYSRTAAVDTVGGFGYVGGLFDYDSASIARVDMRSTAGVLAGAIPRITFAAAALPAGDASSTSIATSGEAFACSGIDRLRNVAIFGSFTGHVVRVSLSSDASQPFQRMENDVAAITGPGKAGEGRLYSMAIAPGSGFAFFGTYGDPATVIKFNLATFAFDSQLVLESPVTNLNAAVMDARGIVIYFASGSESAAAAIVAIDVSGLLRPGPRFLGAVVVSPMLLVTAAGDPNANIAYFASYMAPQMALRWDMTMTLTLVDRPRQQTLPLVQGAGEGLLRAATWYTPSAASAGSMRTPPPAIGVFGTCASPAIVFRVALQGMARLDTLNLPSYEDYLAAVAVVSDPPSAPSAFPRAYFVTDRAGMGGEPQAGLLPQERLVEVELGVLPNALAASSGTGMRRLSSLSLPAAARTGVFVLWHADTASLLVGAAAAPGMVLRVAVAPGGGMTLQSTYALEAVMGEGAGAGRHVLSAGVLDAGQDVLFVATATTPGRVLALSTRSGTLTALGPSQDALPPLTRFLTFSPSTGLLFAGSGTLAGVVSSYTTAGALDGTPVQPQGSTPLLPLPGGTSARVAAVDDELGFLYVATDGDPPALVQLNAADLSIVSRYDLEAGTQRPAALLLVPNAGLPTDIPNVAEPVLVMATDSVPGFMHAFHPTPRLPRLRSVEPALLRDETRLRPPPSVCAGIAATLALQSSSLAVHACDTMPRSGALAIAGSLFGLFAPPDPYTLQVRLTISVSLSHILSLLEDGSWVADELNADLAAAAPAVIECSSLACSDGSTCACLLDVRSIGMALANHVRRIIAAGRPTPVLRALRISLVATRDGRTSPAYAMALVLGAPQILSVSPAVIARHGATLRVETVLLTPFDPAVHQLVLEEQVPPPPGSSNPLLTSKGATYACQLTLGSAPLAADAQTFDCTPPPLSPAVAGRVFRMSLRNASGVVLAQLRSPVRYAWPVIAGVTAADATQTTVRFGRRLKIQAPAMAVGAAACSTGTGAAASPRVQIAVWVASSPCVNTSVSDACKGFVECASPPGIGLRVPLRVEVQLPSQGSSSSLGSSSGFNITSFEALVESSRGDAVATYDGSGDVGELPNPPRIGAVSVIDYDTPLIDAVAPPAVDVLPRPTAGPAPRIELRVVGSAFPVLPVQVALGLRLPTAISASTSSAFMTCPAVVAPDGLSASCFLTKADFESAAVQATAQAGPRGSSAAPFAGAVLLAVQMNASVPGWPEHTATSVTSASTIRVAGLPLITAVRPAGGRAGTVIDLEGAAFATGSGAVAVTIGAALCGNVTRVSDALLRCVAPPFADASAASGASTADFAVVVSTDAGPSTAASFRYSDELFIAWSPPDPPAGSGSGSGGVSAAYSTANVSFIGLAPLRPVPAVTLERGTFFQCTLLLGDQAEGSPVRLSGVLTVPVPAGSLPGMLISFPDARLTSTVLAPFTAALVVRCREAATSAEPSTTARSWTVAAPVPRWSNLTMDALRLRSLFAPLDADSPPLFIDLQAQAPAQTGAAVVAAANTMFSLPTVAAALETGLSCSASISIVGSPLPLLADIPGALVSSSASVLPGGGSSALPSGSGAAGSAVRFAFPRATLASVPLASSVVIGASCRLDSRGSGDASGVVPTSAAVEVRLQTVAAAAVWELPPPQLIESQAPISPAPRVKLQLLGGAVLAAFPVAAPLSCSMSAVPAGNGSATSAAGSGAMTDSVVVPQTVAGLWTDSLPFPAVAVNGRRRARFEVTASCMLGTQPLPTLRAPTEIRGCRAGQAPSGTNGWLCTDCSAGNYSLGGDMPCTACPAVGSECGTGVLALKPGFFRPASQVGQPFTRDTELHACLLADACTLNASTMVHGCNAAEGYGGALCAVCQDGFAPSAGRKCARCWSPAANAIVIALLAAALVGAAFYLAVFSRPGSRSPAALALRQAVTLLQSVSVIGAFRLQASALARSVLGWTDVSNTSLLNVGPLACVLRLPFLARFLTTLLLPLAFGALVAALAAAADATGGCRKGKPRQGARAAAHSRSAWQSHAAVAAGAEAAFAKPIVPAALPGGPASRSADAARGSAAARVPLRTRLLSVTLTLLSLLYMPLISSSLQALACYDRPVDGVTYLLADMSVVCGEGGHAVARGLAWSTLVLLGLGFPLAIVVLLTRVGRVRPLRAPPAASESRRQKQFAADAIEADQAGDSSVPPGLARSELLRTMRPLWDGYRRDFLAWEASTFLRKLLLALVGAFLAPRIAGIALFALLLAVALFLQMAVAPFEEPRFNNGEAVSLACALMIGLLAMLYEGEDATDPANSAVTAAIAVVLAVGLGFLLLQLVRVGAAEARALLMRLASCCPCAAGRTCCTKVVAAGAGSAQGQKEAKAGTRAARVLGGRRAGGTAASTRQHAADDEAEDDDGDAALQFRGSNEAYAHDLPKMLRAANLGPQRHSAVALVAAKAGPSSPASRGSVYGAAGMSVPARMSVAGGLGGAAALTAAGAAAAATPAAPAAVDTDKRHVAAAVDAAPTARRKLRMSLGVSLAHSHGHDVQSPSAASSSSSGSAAEASWTANPVASPVAGLYADSQPSRRASQGPSPQFKAASRGSAAPVSFAALPTPTAASSGGVAGARYVSSRVLRPPAAAPTGVHRSSEAQQDSESHSASAPALGPTVSSHDSDSSSLATTFHSSGYADATCSDAAPAARKSAAALASQLNHVAAPLQPSAASEGSEDGDDRW